MLRITSLSHPNQWIQRRFLHSKVDILISPAALSRPKPPRAKKRSIRSSRRFVDRTRLRVEAGLGGKGSLSTHTLPRRKRRPDGGHGGSGGSVVVLADPHETALQRTYPHKAMKGENGLSQDRFGAGGENLILRVPVGTEIRRILDYEESWDWDHQPLRVSQSKVDKIVEGSSEGVSSRDVERLLQGEEIDVFPENENVEPPPVADRVERKSVILADLDEPGAHIMVARGGKGGRGSCLYAKEFGPLPDVDTLRQNASPDPGEVVYLEFVLKMIADVGLVGFPNAGKSSLLGSLSAAKPRVAPYPFTTLHPTVGCIDYQDGFRLRMADIPGLVPGAASGRGQGHDFLRHIERTRALVYIVDAAGTEKRDPVEDFMVLVDELNSYKNGALLDRRALVLANKVDLMLEEGVYEVLERLKEASQLSGIDMFVDPRAISADGSKAIGLRELAANLRTLVDDSRQEDESAGGTDKRIVA